MRTRTQKQTHNRCHAGIAISACRTVATQVAELLALWSTRARQGAGDQPPPTCRSIESHYLPSAGEFFDGLQKRLDTVEPRVPDKFGMRVERAVLAVIMRGRNILQGHARARGVQAPFRLPA